MIPRDYITAWRSEAPWVQDFQVEQDLIISRALVEIFSDPLLRKSFAFRGGTALYKLHINPPARYSEDIDLVQVETGPIGPAMNALRAKLDPWLGTPQWKQTEGRVTLNYRFTSEDNPPIRLRLKVEINTREHFAVHGFTEVPLAVASRWFEGSCSVTTYELNELLGTKLRALYQRRKGRDLFDLALALRSGGVSPKEIVAAFSAYMEHSGDRVTRALFERNLALKLRSAQFAADIGPLLASGHAWDMKAAAGAVGEQLLSLLPGGPWKGEESAE